MNDVKVMNVKTGTVMIEDISVDVPQGVVVSIPADKALRSKDLWRKISQRLLFRFHGGSIHSGMPMPATPVVPTPVPEAPAVPVQPSTVHALEEQNRMLRETLEQREEIFVAALLAQQGRHEEILSAVRGIAAGGPLSSGSGARTSTVDEGIPGDAPIFIPSTIKSKDLEAHVNVQQDEGGADGVSAATLALRRLREKQGS